MKLYADTPARRMTQLLSDLCCVLWLALWAWVALGVHEATAALAAPGRRIEDAGSGLTDNLRQAADSADAVPVGGEELRAPFEGAGDASAALAEAGRDQAAAVTDLALLLGVLTFTLPALLAVLVWLPLRARFVRRASAMQRLLDQHAGEGLGRRPDLDLFALRALVRQPVDALARVGDDPAGRWRGGDEDVVRALAALELRAAGLAVTGPAEGRESSAGR